MQNGHIFSGSSRTPMDPILHANATLKEQATDETHNMASGMSWCWVGGSFENSWRPTIKQNSLFLKAQPLFKVLLLGDPSMKTSWGLNKESDMRPQKHHSC